MPGPSPGPSNQNLWAEARLGLTFLKAPQVILKYNQGWNHCLKGWVITGKSSREPLGVTNDVLKHQTLNQGAGRVISVMTVINVSITTAHMTSTDKQRMKVREERRTKRKRLRKVLYEDWLTENNFKSPSSA